MRADDICERKEKFPDECDDIIAISYKELESRIGPSMLKKGLANDYPDGYNIEVGKGSTSVGTIYLRAVSIKDKYGLDWTLIIGLGKRSFFTKFERLSSVMIISSLGLIAFNIVIASMLSKLYYRKQYLPGNSSRRKNHKLNHPKCQKKTILMEI